MVGTLEALGGGRTVLQDAVRLLLLIQAAGTELQGAELATAPDGAVAVVKGQMLLQALDFWLRNPDYLADELLSRYGGGGDAADLELASAILDGDEPEVRSYPMLRYLFGAYEPLDEALAVLRTPGLVIVRRTGVPGSVKRADYYLTAAGSEVAAAVISAAPDFTYYVERAKVVIDLAAGRSGSQLKAVQYQQAEYGETKVGFHITGISDRVRARLAALRSDLAEGKAS
jgi:hypothetical protein